MLREINEATEFIRKRIPDSPEVGVILGTGLGNLLVKEIRRPIVINYNVIPHFPISTVESHKGQLIYGELKGKKIVAMQGRFHYYEGYTMRQVTLPLRVMKFLGVQHLLISNAAGNMNLKWRKGELMLIDDHINLQPDNPLRGENSGLLGPRFPDMSQPYSEKLNKELIRIARKKKIKLHQGVYAGVMGPNMETRAEYRYIRMSGADVVGMSTVPEVIVANHMSLPCCAISVLTNDCDPKDLHPVELKQIVETAGSSEKKLVTLFTELISQL